MSTVKHLYSIPKRDENNKNQFAKKNQFDPRHIVTQKPLF